MSNISTIVKSIQDIMRKDVGIDGDAQRIGQLVWMLFLKLLDDREEELELFSDYQSPLPDRYRWRNWAKNPEGLTGDDLVEFINSDLFPFLKSELQTHGKNVKRAQVIKTTFEDAYNYMKSGTLTRQVINKICEIDFNKSVDRHTFGDVYESLLKDLQSAGNSGEFYTPRSLTQFIVERLDPKLEETVLDPACGTGGFLSSVIDYKREKYVRSADAESTLQSSIRGIDKKPLPHMLCSTNMILHGVDVPSKVTRDNALARPIRDYGPADRVDVIATNPPFGGVEEEGIERNFPTELQTKETADLFLVLIVRLLKPRGRAGIILPEGSMFGGGVKSRIKELLLKECNLHTVVRLPKGVFQPYTDIATNLLFFEKGSPTTGVWFYEHPLPEHRAHLKGRTYSASDSLKIQEFEPLLEWWDNRSETDQAWYVPIDALMEEGFDLDQRHPKHGKVNLPKPSDISASIKETTGRFQNTLRSIESSVKEMKKIDAPKITLGELLIKSTNQFKLEDDEEYTRPTVQMHFRGMRKRDRKYGREIGTKTQTGIREGDLIFSRIDAHNGAMAIVPRELDGAIATNDFPSYAIDKSRIEPKYLRYLLFQPSMIEVYYHLSKGSTNRRRIVVDKLMALEIPVPKDLAEQRAIVAVLENTEEKVAELFEYLGGIEEDAKQLTSASLHHVFN